ncbi:hypothetical protein HAU06_20595 [Bacillus toyonensis]|uniref:hypothetical protein n=1 Tax=Bacillus toyonensis TaxID=155322 RepID=UPI000BEB63EB|nr:hypothetical protein [Bacillus toyonensis]MBC2686477.1 hypothetical protein [Bacillus toyonensis]PDY86320.1 hypothetical protein CON67_25375 [Bacillus toyonensis]
MDRELLKVTLFETGQGCSISEIYMTFSDYQVFLEHIKPDGIKYDDGDIVHRYKFKQVDLRLTKEKGGAKIYTADVTFLKES